MLISLEELNLSGNLLSEVMTKQLEAYSGKKRMFLRNKVHMNQSGQRRVELLTASIGGLEYHKAELLLDCPPASNYDEIGSARVGGCQRRHAGKKWGGRLNL